MPGVEITVPWPTGEVVIDEEHPNWDWTVGPSKYIINSADPNDHYRPWLEKYVGRQGWDWNWEYVLGPPVGNMRGVVQSKDAVKIKIRQKKAKYATIASLMWN